MESWEPSKHLLLGTGKPRKTCVEVADRRTFRILSISHQSGIESKKQQCTHSTTNTHKTTHKTTTTIHAANQQQLHTHIFRLILDYTRKGRKNNARATLSCNCCAYRTMWDRYLPQKRPSTTSTVQRSLIFSLSSWSYLFYLFNAGVDRDIVSPDNAQ